MAWGNSQWPPLPLPPSPAPAAQPRRRKSRADLVHALRELQGLIGTIGATYGNDRQPDRADKMQVLVDRAFNIAVDALATDPPA